jgi:4-diphosphocytidyl-2-C-methyl-D-erythritol kinase
VKNFKIKSFCKINLSLKVIKRLNNGYHNIQSLITFCGLYDLISISKIKNLNDKISFSGKFKKGINQKSNTVAKVLDLLRRNKFFENQTFKINIQKNIPHGSGLGGGSSNAAALLNYFNSKMNLKLNRKKMKKIASQVGFDVPINLERRNTFLTGKRNEILRLNQKFNLNLLIVYPNLICSTKKIYKKNRKISLSKPQSFFYIKNKKKLINLLKNENNDLEKTVTKIYPKVKKIIDLIKSQKGCYFSRITGSGSACIGIFSNTKNAIYALKLIKLKYPKYWCAVSKTI